MHMHAIIVNEKDNEFERKKFEMIMNLKGRGMWESLEKGMWKEKCDCIVFLKQTKTKLCSQSATLLCAKEVLI